ncbi:hypothetical protein BC943DRAFT_338245 [Umbelopsis sp. AD052]|nr:hypothetical protein BC943DRAFT_338245 [Umbelopsis sp. AD052]
MPRSPERSPMGVRSKEGRAQKKTLKVLKADVGTSDSQQKFDLGTHCTTEEEANSSEEKEPAPPALDEGQRTPPTRPMTARVIVSGQPLRVIIDTSAGASIFSASLATTLGLSIDESDGINIESVDGTEKESLGTCREVEAKIGDEKPMFENSWFKVVKTTYCC